MIILASTSPRRKQLLKKIVDDFQIQGADIDENEDFLTPDFLSYDLARLKAYEVYRKFPNDVIIACDTIVVFNEEIYGKPKDKDDAYRMLKNLSNNHHIVLTSYTIISKNFEINRTIKSTVYLNELDEKTIEKYIATGSPMDKAGGYGCQDEQFNLVKKIVGSFDNVMGFPTESIARELKKFNIIG